MARSRVVMACEKMVSGFVLFWLGAHPSWLVAVGVAALLLSCANYVASRPSLVAEP